MSRRFAALAATVLTIATAGALAGTRSAGQAGHGDRAGSSGGGSMGGPAADALAGRYLASYSDGTF
jgi:hypothetical protein